MYIWKFLLQAVTLKIKSRKLVGELSKKKIWVCSTLVYINIMKFFNLGKIKELTFTLDAYIKSLGDATIVVVSLLVVVLIASTVDRTVRKNRGENAEKQNAEEENLGERETLYQEMVFCPFLFECPM